jgi:hypothetical protein
MKCVKIYVFAAFTGKSICGAIILSCKYSDDGAVNEKHCLHQIALALAVGTKISRIVTVNTKSHGRTGQHFSRAVGNLPYYPENCPTFIL